MGKNSTCICGLLSIAVTNKESHTRTVVRECFKLNVYYCTLFCSRSGLGLGLGLDLMSLWLVVMHTY